MPEGKPLGESGSPPSQPRRQHYVPQMYLRAFADPAAPQGELWRYAPMCPPRLRSPKGVAFRDYFYDMTGEVPSEENDMEHFYGETETLAAPHLETLRSGTIRLGEQAKSEMASFIALLRTRTVEYREAANALSTALYRNEAGRLLSEPGAFEDFVAAAGSTEDIDASTMRRALEALVVGSVSVKQESRAYDIRQALEMTEHVDALISEMSWNLMEAREGPTFITSDNPVVISDPLSRLLGPGTPPTVESQLHFPLSPKYLLAGGFNCPNEAVIVASAEQVAAFNRNQVMSAHGEVYACLRSEELQRQVDEGVRPWTATDFLALLEGAQGTGRH